MNRIFRLLLALALVGVLWTTLVGATLLLMPPIEIAAQPQPSKSPIDPTATEPTEEPTTEEPTEEPTQEPTEEPTQEPTEEPTLEPTEEPTEEPTKEPTQEPTEEPTKEPTEDPAPAPKPDPDCQSSVEGVVTDAAGQPVAGAAVTIEGEGWSNGILTDDQGRYGFAGLCAGTVTLSAALPGGPTLPGATVSLDGESSTRVDLGVSQQQPATATNTQVPQTPQPTAENKATPEPSMPATGFPGWLLVGGAALGTLVLLSLGLWRTLVTARAQDRS